MKSHASIASMLFTGGIFVGLVIGCKSGARTNVPSLSASPTNAAARMPAKYFDGSQACKFLANIEGFDLGAYVPYTQTEGYTCQKIEPSIKLSCNPQSDLLCNSISYQVNGEKEGATSAELFYMGTSLSSSAHKNDMQTFLLYSNQLAEKSLGVGLDSQIRRYVLDAKNFLPMKPETDIATVDRNTLNKKLGSGFVSVLARRNDSARGPAYMIRFTVFPDQRWSNLR